MNKYIDDLWEKHARSIAGHEWLIGIVNIDVFDAAIREAMEAQRRGCANALDHGPRVDTPGLSAAAWFFRTRKMILNAEPDCTDSVPE